MEPVYLTDRNHPVWVASRGAAYPPLASPFDVCLRDRRSNAILKAALDTWRLGGYASASIKEVSWAADVSVASIYHRFTSKQRLFAYVARDCLRHRADALLDVLLDDDDVEPCAVVRALIWRQLEWVSVQQTAAHFLSCHPDLEVDPGDRRAVPEAIADWAEHAMTEDRLPHLPRGLIHAQIMGPALACTEAVLLDQIGLDLGDAATALGDLAWQALKPVPRLARAAARR